MSWLVSIIAIVALFVSIAVAYAVYAKVILAPDSISLAHGASLVSTESGIRVQHGSATTSTPGLVLTGNGLVVNRLFFDNGAELKSTYTTVNGQATTNPEVQLIVDNTVVAKFSADGMETSQTTEVEDFIQFNNGMRIQAVQADANTSTPAYLSISGDLSMTGGLTVQDDIAVTGNAAITGNLAVTGTSTTTGAATFSAGVAIAGDTSCSNDVTVDGNVVIAEATAEGVVNSVLLNGDSIVRFATAQMELAQTENSVALHQNVYNKGDIPVTTWAGAVDEAGAPTGADITVESGTGYASNLVCSNNLTVGAYLSFDVSNMRFSQATDHLHLYRNTNSTPVLVYDVNASTGSLALSDALAVTNTVSVTGTLSAAGMATLNGGLTVTSDSSTTNMVNLTSGTFLRFGTSQMELYSRDANTLAMRHNMYNVGSLDVVEFYGNFDTSVSPTTFTSHVEAEGLVGGEGFSFAPLYNSLRPGAKYGTMYWFGNKVLMGLDQSSGKTEMPDANAYDEISNVAVSAEIATYHPPS